MHGHPHAVRRRLAAATALAVVVLVIAFFGGGDLLGANETVYGKGHLAPDFTLKTVEGKTIRLSDLRGKKVVLVNFWATWCPPCRLEMPTMQQIYAEYKRRGFEILAINVDADATQEIRDFVKELRLTFPVLLDPRMEVARRYRVRALPASVLINRKGVIRHIGLGYRTWTEKEPRSEVEQLLQ